MIMLFTIRKYLAKLHNLKEKEPKGKKNTWMTRVAKASATCQKKRKN